MTAHQRIDDTSLDARVPGATRLGCCGVDVCRPEGQLAGVAQHGLAQELLVARGGEIGHGLLDDVDRNADERDRLLQVDVPRQLSGGRPEDLRPDRQRLPRAPEPLREQIEPLVQDKAHVGPLLSR